MNTEVTIASKKEQKISQIASAVFVITQEDIRNSGATNIPDLLRMVPGVEVAQINADVWAITARGLNARYSNELLVLLDGRSVYTPTFGGVFWDTLDVPLENIERIEVIRGPGSSIWGSNAVNGVINIITKKASETQGVMVVAGGGNLDQGFSTLEYGGHLGAHTAFNIYSKYFNQTHLPSFEGNPNGDGWDILRGGARLNSAISSKDTLTLLGGIYTGLEGNPSLYLPSVTSPGLVPINIELNVSGGFVQGIWHRTNSQRLDTNLQVSFDRYKRNDTLREGRNTFDIELQNHFAWNSRQNLVWGAGFTYSSSQTDPSLSVSLNPPDLDTEFFNWFIQDEITLVHNRLTLTPGARLEHDYYNGFTLMPSIRMMWNATPHQALWMAISRSVRTPSSVDTGIRINLGSFVNTSGQLVLNSIFGNPGFQNENLTAYEAGYRASLGDRLSLDLSAYFDDYDNQETTEPESPFLETTPSPPHLVMPLVYQNLGQASACGIEIFANWQPIRRWTISPGYSFQKITFGTLPGSHDTETAASIEGSDPANSAQLRSHLSLTKRLDWNASAYFVDRLDAQGVPAYTRLDTGLNWDVSRALSIGLYGQNLIQDHHLEFFNPSEDTLPTLVKRSAYAKITWRIRP